MPIIAFLVIFDTGLTTARGRDRYAPGGSKAIDTPPSERGLGGREGLPEQW